MVLCVCSPNYISTGLRDSYFWTCFLCQPLIHVTAILIFLKKFGLPANFCDFPSVALPQSPFSAVLKPSPFFSYTMQCMPLDFCTSFPHCLEYLSHSLAQFIYHIYASIKLAFSFLKQFLSHPRIAEESRVCKNFLSGLPVFAPLSVHQQ